MSQLEELKTSGIISNQVSNINTEEATIDIDAQFFTPDTATTAAVSSANNITSGLGEGTISTNGGNVPLSDIEEAANRRLSIIHENAMVEKAKLDAENSAN